MKNLELANKLERILRNYLKCNYNEFGVKANGNLSDVDWKSPINFALGHVYAKANNSKEAKDAIDSFLGNKLIGESITDLVNDYESYSFSNEDEVYSYINTIIEELEKLLNMDFSSFDEC